MLNHNLVNQQIIGDKLQHLDYCYFHSWYSHLESKTDEWVSLIYYYV